MTAKLTLVIDAASEDAARFRQLFDRQTSKRMVLENIQTHLQGLKAGVRRARVFVNVASAFASQTVTASAAAGVPGDTIVVAGTTLTNAAAPANENEFADAATDALLAASVAAAINAHSTLQKIVRASSSGATITIMCVFPGAIGNLVTLTETGNGFTLGGATLASGAADETDELRFGYAPTT